MLRQYPLYGFAQLKKTLKKGNYIMNKILKKIKVVFIDFEECLCVSLKHTGWQESCGMLSYNPYMDANNCSTLPFMREFIAKCKCHGISRIGLSDVRVGFGAGGYKSEFVESKYGLFALNHLVHVSDVENKLLLVKSYCTSQTLTGTKSLPPNKCLIVTSSEESVKVFVDNGFIVMTPQELVARLNRE